MQNLSSKVTPFYKQYFLKRKQEKIMFCFFKTSRQGVSYSDFFFFNITFSIEGEDLPDLSSTVLLGAQSKPC